MKKGSRAREFETAIQWLVDAGLVHKIYRCKTPEIPLKFYEDFNAFKLYLLDVGLLGALAGASPAQMIVSNDVFKEYRGAFTENYVLQQLMLDEELSISYFSKKKFQYRDRFPRADVQPFDSHRGESRRERKEQITKTVYYY